MKISIVTTLWIPRKLTGRFKRCLKALSLSTTSKEVKKKNPKSQRQHKAGSARTLQPLIVAGLVAPAAAGTAAFHLTDKANVNLLSITIHPVLNLVKENCPKS